MELDELDTELRNLRELPTPPRPPIEVLATRTRRRHRHRTLAVALASVTAVVATGVGLRAATRGNGVRVSSTGPDATVVESATSITVAGIEVETPAGWSAEPSTNEHGEVLYLRGDSGAELHIVVRPTPSQAPGPDEVLSAVSALGDGSAVITEVEGGYALYAELDCPAEPCVRLEVFGYNLSLAEFTELSSGL